MSELSEVNDKCTQISGKIIESEHVFTGSEIKENITFFEVKDSKIPDFQRPLDAKVVLNMQKHIRSQKKIKKKPYFGVLDICILDDTKYIIDGQHRFEALKNEYSKRPDSEDLMNFIDDNIKFDAIYYYVDSYEEMLNIFQVRNLGVEIPEYVRNSDDKNRNLLFEINAFISEFHCYKNTSVKRPHIHINGFLNFLVQENVLEELNISNMEDFKKLFKRKNKIIKKNIRDEDYRKKNEITVSMIEKCEAFQNYLGLIKNHKWIFEVKI